MIHDPGVQVGASMSEAWSKFKIQPDKTTLVRYATERIVRMAKATLEVNETFSLALSGGSTPEPVYQMMATEFASVLDWQRIHLFWGDERCVPPDDPQSNYHMAHETLIQHVPIPERNVHRIHGEDDPAQAAVDYEEELGRFFGDDEEWFDLTLLGMGDDGHTASIFPGTAAVQEREKMVYAHHVEAKGDLWRITLTAPAILRSSNIMFLIAGADKAPAVHEVLEGEFAPDTYPSQLIARSEHPHIIYALDEAAAAQLS